MSRPTTDTWGDEPSLSVKHITTGSGSGIGPSRTSKTTKAPAVIDDWELDNDDEDDAAQPLDVQNKQIWEDANSKESRPMPSLVISRSFTSSIVTPSLPLNQPPAMRILKRPSPAISPSASSTAPVGETFQEREARYQAARERIFGSSTDSSQNSGGKKSPKAKKATSPTSPSNPSAKISREPRGPTSPNANAQGNAVSNGFGERSGRRPPGPSTPIQSVSAPLSTTNIPA